MSAGHLAVRVETACWPNDVRIEIAVICFEVRFLARAVSGADAPPLASSILAGHRAQLVRGCRCGTENVLGAANFSRLLRQDAIDDLDV